MDDRSPLTSIPLPMQCSRFAARRGPQSRKSDPPRLPRNEAILRSRRPCRTFDCSHPSPRRKRRCRGSGTYRVALSSDWHPILGRTKKLLSLPKSALIMVSYLPSGKAMLFRRALLEARRLCRHSEGRHSRNNIEKRAGKAQLFRSAKRYQTIRISAQRTKIRIRKLLRSDGS